MWLESLICSWDSCSAGPARLRPEEERRCPGGLGITQADRSFLLCLAEGHLQGLWGSEGLPGARWAPALLLREVTGAGRSGLGLGR